MENCLCDLDYTLIEPRIDWWVVAGQLLGRKLSPPTVYGIEEYDAEAQDIIVRVFRSEFYTTMLQESALYSRQFVSYFTKSTTRNLNIVTSRPPEIFGSTLRFVNEMFGCVGVIPVEKALDKVEIARERNANLLIDDDERVVLKAVKAGCQSFLIDRPWNRHCTDLDPVRILAPYVALQRKYESFSS
jgi:hypothetical protein